MKRPDGADLKRTWVEYANWLEAEREEASQEYADLLKDYRALRRALNPSQTITGKLHR
jgi:hypothetical protein